MSNQLAFRVIDADNNPSRPVFVYLIFRAPTSYKQYFWPILWVPIIVSFLFGLSLIALYFKSGLPFTLFFRQGILQWWRIGKCYRLYRLQWAALNPLEQLLLLVAPSIDALTPDQWQQHLTEQQTPVIMHHLTSALGCLVHNHFLYLEHGRYCLTQPGLTQVLQQHEGAPGLSKLSGCVRTQHPLFDKFCRFIEAAGFSISTNADDPLAFLCQPTSSTSRQTFLGPVHARLFPDAPLTRHDVKDFYDLTEARQDRIQLLFIIINQTPDNSVWSTIDAIKVKSNIQIIPIDDILIQRGREQQEERQTLDQYLKRYLGHQRDLYNVRDPVTGRLSFFGREARTAKLLKAIADGQRLMLFGLRKMGKSSLLQHLRDHAPFPSAYIQIKSNMQLPLLYNNILKSLQNSMRTRVEEEIWEPPTLIGHDPSSNFIAAILDSMEWLKHNGHDSRLGIFIDEIELMIPQVDNAAIDDRTIDNYLHFAQALCEIVQKTNCFSLLATGVQPLVNREACLFGHQNPFYQFFHEEYLEPLGLDSCIQMICNIGRQMGLDYDDAAVLIAQMSGGYPFLARQLCSLASETFRQETGTITLLKLQDAAEFFLEEPGIVQLLDERGLWGEVTNTDLWPQAQIDEHEALLTSLAYVENQSRLELLNDVQKRPLREHSLSELEQRAILGRSDERLYIKSGLFRDWVKLRLPDRIRAKFPLFAEFRQFIETAGFSLSDVPGDPLAFLCKPTSSTSQQLFAAPVYARLFPDVPLTRQEVAELYSGY